MKIKFKSEFEQKLLKFGIKRKFVRNFKNGWAYDKIPEGIEVLNDAETWRSFVSGAFLWRKTPEEYKFWENISLM